MVLYTVLLKLSLRCYGLYCPYTAHTLRFGETVLALCTVPPFLLSIHSLYTDGQIGVLPRFLGDTLLVCVRACTVHACVCVQSMSA